MKVTTPEKSALALLPFGVFIVIFLVSGILLNDFYAFPAPIVALCGICVACFVPEGKIKLFVRGFFRPEYSYYVYDLPSGGSLCHHSQSHWEC